MDSEQLQKRLTDLFLPFFEQHYEHSCKVKKYQMDTGEVDPDPTRLEVACQKAADAVLKAKGGITTVKFQADFSLLVQVAKDDPENLIANFVIVK